jgi:hypothetical protein
VPPAVRGRAATGSRNASGPGAGSPNARTSPRNERRASSPVTFCSRMPGSQRLEHGAAARDADAPEAPIQLGDHAVSGGEAVRSSVSPTRSGTLARSSFGAGTPCLGDQRSPTDSIASVAGRRRCASRASSASASDAASDRRSRAGGGPACRPGRGVRRVGIRSVGTPASLARAARVGWPPASENCPISPIIRRDVRHPRVVALVALTATIAAVAVPGPVVSQAQARRSRPVPTSSTMSRLRQAVRGPVTTTQPLDPGHRSARSPGRTLDTDRARQANGVPPGTG